MSSRSQSLDFYVIEKCKNVNFSISKLPVAVKMNFSKNEFKDGDFNINPDGHCFIQVLD